MKVEQQIEYEAKSDEEAYQVARERLGREAVILSSRPVKLGGFLGMFKRDALWVTAGILVPDKEDEKRESHDRMMAFQHLLDVRRAVGGDEPPIAGADSAPRASAFTPGKQAASAYEANSKAAKPAGSQLSKDVDEIKDTLAKVLERLSGEDVRNSSGEAREPLDDNAHRLVAADVDRAIALGLAEEYKERGGGKSFEEWLVGVVPTTGDGTDTTGALGGRKILFCGPTGAGKTTTIAKIASELSLWEDKNVVLMTSDTYRIAAVEQLRTYAKILSVPIEIVPEPKDLQMALKKHRDADLILLDTAGRSHFDGGRIAELRALYDAFEPDNVHLVIASNVKYRDVLDIIERMGVVPLSSMLFTKLDETSSYGIILNVLRDFDLPLSFFTKGQDVPKDIEVARADRFVDLLLKNVPIREDAQ